MSKWKSKLWIIVVGGMTITILLIGTVYWVGAQSPTSVVERTDFNPATVFQGEIIRAMAYNPSNVSGRYLFIVTDAVTGEIIETGGSPECDQILPKKGCFKDFGPYPSDRLVVITIIGMFQSGLGTNQIPRITLGSVEIIDPASGELRLLLPAVQA